MRAEGAAFGCLQSNLVDDLLYVSRLLFELSQQAFSLWLHTANSRKKDVLFGCEVSHKALPEKTHSVRRSRLGTIVRFAILWQADCEAKSEQQATVIFTREGNKAGMSLGHRRERV